MNRVQRFVFSLFTSSLLLTSVQPIIASTGDTVTDPDSGTGATIEESGIGTIEIEQQSPIATYSEWTLIKPDNITLKGRHMHQKIEDAKTGNYTILIDPLQGATAQIQVSVNGEVVAENEYARAAFTLRSDDVATILITNTFTRIGTVSVQSSPPGIEFTLTGPNSIEMTGATPAEYLDMPEGLYTALFHEIKGCIEPQPRSDRLQKDSRITLSLTISCDILDELEPVRERTKTLQFVTVKIEGENVTFTDVPVDAWFAAHVHQALRLGIMSGFQDESGRLRGIYGPESNVSIAELSKIAHKAASIDINDFWGMPKNARARNTWFSRYFASAEERGWLVFQDKRLDPGRNATRAEVVATLLQAFDVPRNWPSGGMFVDISMDAPFSACIETAAASGLVSGYMDTYGNQTGEFKPDNPINRAEMAKIVSIAVDLYAEDTAEIQPGAP